MSATNKQKLTTSLPYTILALIMLGMVLTGCDLREPSLLSENRIQVEEEQFTDKMLVSAMNDVALSALAKHYDKHGDGPLALTVTYDPKSKTGNAMHASDEVGRLVKALGGKGVRNVDANILPIKDLGSEMQAMVSYTAYNALAPKDCEMMTAESGEDYKLGCTVDILFAKQIARPKDLKGQGATDPTTDGRRMANTVEAYRTGVPNEPLGGESSTDQ